MWLNLRFIRECYVNILDTCAASRFAGFVPLIHFELRSDATVCVADHYGSAEIIFVSSMTTFTSES